MEFREVEHKNTVFASGVDFTLPRTVSLSSEIPLIGPFGFSKKPEPIRLHSVSTSTAEKFVESRGAYKKFGHWFVDRNDPFPFDLDEFLPRMARKSIIPELSDLIPKVCWNWSLARMMVQSDWDNLVDDVIRSQRSCRDCGGVSIPVNNSSAPWAKDPGTKRLDGHEVWSFNGVEQTGFYNEGVAIPGIQRLVAIHALCGRCHETKHLGNALHRNEAVFKRAFARLGAINRVSFEDYPKGEAAAYSEEIFAKYKARNRARKYWAMDFAALGGRRLKLKSSISYIGDNFIERRNKSGVGVDKVRIINADFLKDGNHVVIVPHGWK